MDSTVSTALFGRCTSIIGSNSMEKPCGASICRHRERSENRPAATDAMTAPVLLPTDPINGIDSQSTTSNMAGPMLRRPLP